MRDWCKTCAVDNEVNEIDEVFEIVWSAKLL